VARAERRRLTELELDIMRIVWRRKEATVKDLSDALAQAGRPLALPSIRTMLSILQGKGYVERRPAGRGHVYRAVVSADDGRHRILRDVLDRVFDGSAASLVTALVNGKFVSRREMKAVKQLIERHEKGVKE